MPYWSSCIRYAFTAIADLTEAEVIEWAKANHPVDHMQEVITKKINEKITPKSEDVTEVSWLEVVVPKLKEIDDGNY